MGYQSLQQFAKRHHLHRNTLSGLLGGKSVFLPSFRKVVEQLKIDPMELLIPASSLSPSIPFIDEIKPVVGRLLKERKEIVVLLLGSRTKKKAKKYSDWDIGIFSHHSPVGGLEYLRLKRLVEEATENIVRQVDLVNLNQAPVWFLENLKILFLDGDKESYTYLQGLIDGIAKEREAA